MNCPRCECHIADGFYCIGCGYVPTQIDARTNTKASILDIDYPRSTAVGVDHDLMKGPSQSLTLIHDVAP